MFQVRGNPRLKMIDRAVGVPVVRALGLLPKRKMPASVRSIGVLRTAAIGDTLLLRGILDDIHAQRANVRLLLITGRTNAEAGALVATGVAEHVVVPERNPAGALAMLRPLQLDLLVDTGAWPRLDAILAALSGARYRVGFRTQAQSRHFAFDAVVEHSDAVHEVDNFRALFRAAGVESRRDPSLRGVPLPDLPESLTQAPYFVFHPWSGGYKGHIKEWPPERWLHLGRALSSRGRMLISGSPSEAARSETLAQQLRAAGVDALAATNLTLSQVAALLKSARAVVSVNTGIMHLAASVGAPTVCLDGPTPARRWGPVGPRVASVSSTLPGCGYLDLGFEYDGQRTDCMLGIDVDRVTAAVRALANLD